MRALKALITGASGFVGAHLARRLVADGWEVHITLRQSSKTGDLDEIAQRVTFHQLDGSTQGMIDIMRQARPDVVFHLASLFLAQHEPKDIEPLVQSNVLFGTQLVEAMSVEGIRHLVNTGTSWQHYESRDYCPVCLYAATKQAFQVMLSYYVEACNLQVVTLKLFDTYGPRDSRGKLFGALRRAASSGEALAMSPGEQQIDLVYIDDVVDAFIRAADRLIRGEAAKTEEYMVTSGKPIRLKDLVKVYSRTVNKRLQVEWGKREYRPREVMTPWCGGVLLPGWSPRIDLVEGIKRMEGIL